MRRAVIAGNWKMHYTLPEAVKTAKELIPLVADADCEVVLCAPFIHLPELVSATAGTNVKIGAQNMHFEEKGAFTGEISPGMLEDLGVDYVIIGHSERRQYFGETDDTVNRKLKAAFNHKLIPIMCCGETLEQREQGETEEHLERQVKGGLANLSPEQVQEMIIAYEPIWAIGTGKTATAQDANDTIHLIRNTVEQLYGEEVAQAVRIQYGGSVKPDTIQEQMAMSDIDGALVGGASLKAADFAAIVRYNK
ncbi:Triosephosphate isomerase [anaerobic digester metagenome]